MIGLANIWSSYLVTEYVEKGDLFDFINQRWGRVMRGKAEHLICKRPWKGEDSDLTMYEDWDEQYDAMLNSVLEAPVWADKTASRRTLEVKIIVYLSDAA